MSDTRDYYALLGIQSNATKAEVKKNYRQLARQFHPDKNSDSDAASKFIAITEAYDVLNNRKRRAAYDLQRWQAIKDSKKSAETFTTYVPPRESLRTRRNRAQQKRSLKYHKTPSPFNKTLFLLWESLLLVGRYVLHIFGMSLALVILKSLAGEVSTSFEEGILKGSLICIIIGFFFYILFKIVQNMFFELKTDIKVFAHSYKLTQMKASVFTLAVFFIVLSIYIGFLLNS